MLKDQWYDAQNEKHEEDTLWLYELWREWKVVAGPWGLKVTRTTAYRGHSGIFPLLKSYRYIRPLIWVLR